MVLHPIAKIYGFRDEGMEIKLALLSITPGNSFYICASQSYTLGFSGLEVPVPSVVALPPGKMVR